MLYHLTSKKFFGMKKKFPRKKLPSGDGKSHTNTPTKKMAGGFPLLSKVEEF